MAENMWNKPIPIVYEKTASFPLMVFPKWIRDYVEGLSKELNTQVDLPANAVFSALSTILMNKYKFHYEKLNWVLELNTYILVAIAPGSKKDAIIKRVFSALKDYQNDLLIKHKGILPEIESKIRSLSKRLEKVTDLYAEQNDKSYEIEAQKIIEEINELEIKKRKPIFLVGGDITQEKLVELLSINNEKLSIVTPEGSELFSYFRGRYNSNSIDIFLKAWEGTEYTKYRLSGDDCRLNNPLLTLCLFTQPIELKILNEFVGRGLAERFLISVPEKFPFEEISFNNPMSKEIEESFHSRLIKLINLEVEDGEFAVKVQEKSKEQFEKLYFKIFKESYNPSYPDSYQEWLLKVFGNLIKLITLIKVSDKMKTSEKEKVIYLDESDITKIEQLFEYYNSHYKKAYGIANNGHKENDLEYLFRRILELECGGKVSSTDLNNNIRRFNSSNRIQLLNVLEEHNLVRMTKKGRSLTININPAIKKMEQYEARLLVSAGER
jgi:hypothetical protein